jgi:hypothetical protein
MNFKGNALVPTKKTYARLVVKEIASILDSFLKKPFNPGCIHPQFY